MELIEIHPAILIAYYAILVLFSFLFNNPYYLLTFIFLMVLLILLQGAQKELIGQFKMFLPIAIFIVLLNSLFNYNGANRIYIWGNFFITLEAFCYGFLMAGTFLLILLTLLSYNKTVSYQNMLYVLSKRLPIISMILVMALRFIPLLQKRAEEIKKLMGLNRDFKASGMISKVKGVGEIMGITVSWSLEEAMLTAKSMKARGYTASKRTSYLSYRLNGADFYFIVFLIIAAAVLVYGWANGYGRIDVYPVIGFSFYDFPFNGYYFIFVIFLLPLIYLELKEIWLWH